MQLITVYELNRAVHVGIAPVCVITRPLYRFFLRDLLTLEERQVSFCRAKRSIRNGFEPMTFQIRFVLNIR